jgi:hypothetical protein
MIWLEQPWSRLQLFWKSLQVLSDPTMVKSGLFWPRALGTTTNRSARRARANPHPPSNPTFFLDINPPKKRPLSCPYLPPILDFLAEGQCYQQVYVDNFT